MIKFDNFYLNTEAVFKGCKVPKREPDYTSYGRWGVSSRYWYGSDKNGEYVIRESDHWVKIKKKDSNNIEIQCDRIASCQWHLNTTLDFNNQAIAGKCYLKHFQRINFM